MVALATVAVAACGSDGSSETYTKAPGRGSCGGRQLIVGDKLQVRLIIKNQSGRPWASTWFWLRGTSDFRIDGVRMNGRPADDTYRSADQWAAGPLPAGGTGRIRIDLPAKEAGAPKVEIAFWGSSEADASKADSIPDGTLSLKCEYAIRP